MLLLLLLILILILHISDPAASITGYFRTRDRNRTVTIRARKNARGRRIQFETLTEETSWITWSLERGPASLQLGYFLARAGRDCQIQEAGT